MATALTDGFPKQTVIRRRLMRTFLRFRLVPETDVDVISSGRYFFHRPLTFDDFLNVLTAVALDLFPGRGAVLRARLPSIFHRA
jgi:hypothetical protein